MHLGGKLSVEPNVRLRKRDGQDGTAIVVFAAFIDALRLVDERSPRPRS
jgi:hypothetical protein